MLTQDQALVMAKLWAVIDTDHGRRRAHAWWYMVEGIRYDSQLLQSIAELLLLDEPTHPNLPQRRR